MRPKWDWLLFTLICFTGIISLLVIFSQDKKLATNQFVFWILGLVVLTFASGLHHKIWLKLSTPFYLVTLFSLLVLPFIGEPVRGSIRWIDLSFFRIQPSEIAKVASILALATFYLEKSARSLKIAFLGFLIITPALLLVFIQPDIGSSLSFLAIWFGLTFANGLKIKHILVLIIIASLITFLSYEFLAPYQKERIESFLAPSSDPLGAGYHLIQSKISVGSGQLFGRGLGQGSQSQLNFLPESESDFIFATLAEQLGFFGSAFLILIFGAILLKISSFIKDADRLGQLVIIGALSMLLAQFLINVGMNLGVVPVTGITFPLVSYGGSSLVSVLFLLGIIYSVRLNSRI